MPTLDEDREAILEVHKNWWEANHGLDIPLMESCYPRGMAYLMFNLNGHPYFGIEEKVALWEHYRKELDIVEFPDIEIMRIEISGDMAWVGSEGIFPIAVIGDQGTGASAIPVGSEPNYFPGRATEVYQRDDGEGNPVWKMWHFHFSVLPPADEERPGLGGTREGRGLGGGPGITPLRVTRVGTRD
ncbi:MAG: nuclear transport factor 2 family protein [Solirubrobacterales bacterium]